MNNRKIYTKYYSKEIVNKVSRSDFAKISNLFCKFIFKLLLEGYSITLPYRLGKLYVTKIKLKPIIDEYGNIKNLPVDWLKTRQLWLKNEKAAKNKKLIYHLNEHTDMYVYKYIWNKYKSNVKNKIFYSLEISRGNKRALTKQIMTGLL